jgi:beta-lactamase regulating signal transducer with metallopeptidase domain
MNSLFALRALLYAGELLAGSTLILMLAWLGASQKTASARHLSWAGALGMTLALPVLMAIVPPTIRILLTAPAKIAPTPTLNDMALIASASLPATSGFSIPPSTLVLVLGALWLAGVCVVASRVAIAAICLTALKRRSRVYALAPGDEPKVAATRRECELRLCDGDTGPISWGVFRPVVMLPKNALSWPRERLHAVLLHELAHIRRRDSLVQALSHAACAFYWPNPLVWMAARRLRREAEIAADDAVIVTGVKPSAYAGELLQLAREFHAHGPALSHVAFFMAAPSALESRVESLLSPANIRSGVTSMDVLKIAGLGFFAATAIAFARPSFAQEEQPVSPAPAVQVAPIAPPTPAVPPVPAAPAVAADPATVATTPAMGADAADSSVHGRIVIHDRDGLGDSDLKHMRMEVARARREAHAAMARARPEIDKAVAAAKLGEQAVRDAQPQIDAAMAEVAKARPEIDGVMADVQPEIDRALAKVRADLAKEHVDMRIQEKVDAALQRAEIRIEAAHVSARDSHHEDSEREEQSTATPDDDQ